MPVRWLAKEKCLFLLEREVYGRLATSDANGQPYITPVNYVVCGDEIYIHTGFQGRKIENISSNPKVCFEVSGSGKLYATPHARNFTMRFWSVLVFGAARTVVDPGEKLRVMERLMDKYASGHQYERLSLEDMGIVNVIAVSMDEISGKASVDPKSETQ